MPETYEITAVGDLICGHRLIDMGDRRPVARQGSLIELGEIGRTGAPHPCWVNTNQSISSVTASSWLIASPRVRSAAIPRWNSSSDSRAKNESARSADFLTKLGQLGAVTCVTTRCTTGVKPPTA